jgi:hypothetical protein
VSPTEDDQQRELAEKLRSVRDEARNAPHERPSLPAGPEPSEAVAPLPEVASEDVATEVTSPEREDLNALWNVATSPSQGFLGKVISPLRGLAQRLLLGPVVERQVRMNSAQVRFDNEAIEYVDDRLDRMARHYDRVLGLHGKRMEEIDERHRILQQELIRHVHDLVERIEFVFETAETNHLQVDGALRETREELKALVKRLETLAEP